MKNSIRFLTTVLFVTAVAQSALAHFKLLEPTSWLMEDDRGDPQKAGPCGGTNADWGKPSYAVSKVTGGQKIHIKLQETIYHPGHYRVALAVNSPTELPKDPEVTTRDTERGPQSVSAKIQDPPPIPLLADGLLCIPRVQRSRRCSKPMFSCRTSAARNARCNWCSSWPNTASIIPAVTRTITARIFK